MSKPSAVYLSLGTLKPREHLVLGALRKLGKASTAAEILFLVHDASEAEKEAEAESVQVGVPSFVSSLNQVAVDEVMTHFIAGGWASWFSSSRGKVYNLTSNVDKAIQASKRAAYGQTPKTEAQMQQQIVGAMIQLHRASGETTLPIVKYISFHHLTCSVSMAAGLLGSKLKGWVSAQTTFGPFTLKLSPDVASEVTATLESTTVAGKEVYRLNAVPVQVAAAAAAAAEAGATDNLNDDEDEDFQ